MGILSKIGNAVKKGVKWVAGKVGKILNSKWGKALMLAISVVTAGAALAAGAASFSTTAGGFMTKFVAGAKSFVGALMNPVKAVKGIGGNLSTVKDAVTGVSSAASGVAGAAEASSAAAQAAAATGNSGVSSVASEVLSPEAATNAADKVIGQVTQQPGMLAKAANGAVAFLKSSGGGQLAGRVISGYAQGQQQEELLKQQQQIEAAQNAAWQDPSRIGPLKDAAAQGVNVPSGYLDRARRVSEFLNNRQYQYPTQTADPMTVAGYAAAPGG